MSRWTETIAEKTFKGWLNALKTESEKLSDQTQQAHANEIARIRKAIDYIGNLLPSVEAELIPFHLLNGINTSAKQCHDLIGHYLNNPVFEHLENANTKIDEILACIVPYALIGQNKSSAAVQAFMDHIGAKTKQIEILHGNAGDLIKKIQLINSKYQKVDGKINGIENSIQAFEQKTLQSAGGKGSLESRLKNFDVQAKEHCDAIDAYRKNLMEDQNSIISQIDKARNFILEKQKEIASELNTVKAKTDGLHQFYDKAFGEKQPNGKREGGLSQELEDLKAKLEEQEETAKKVYSALEKKVEGLLPGAASAGLAKAYHDLKEFSSKGAKKYAYASYIFIALLLAPPIFEWIFPNLMPASTSNFSKTWYGEILTRVLLLGPILWLAIFSSKRRSEYRRLQEEYAHKEALAKSYMGYKEQIEDLEEGGDKSLMRQLLGAAIDAISFNASTTLDKKHGDKPPLHEAAEGTVDKLKRKKPTE